MPPESPDEGSEMGDVKEENEDDAFAAIIEQALQEGSDDDDEDDDDDSDDEDDGDDGDRDDDDGGSASGSGSGSGSGSDADEDDEEYSGAMKLLADEIRHLEAAIAKKNEDIAKVTNVALKVCPFTEIHYPESTADNVNTESFHDRCGQDVCRLGGQASPTRTAASRASCAKREGRGRRWRRIGR
jgi:TATA-binding protein-associated factor Taf7